MEGIEREWCRGYTARSWFYLMSMGNPGFYLSMCRFYLSVMISGSYLLIQKQLISSFDDDIDC